MQSEIRSQTAAGERGTAKRQFTAALPPEKPELVEPKRFEKRWRTCVVVRSADDNVLGGSQFNTYTSTATNARQMQVSVRFIF